jgi:hypothetical protein
VELVVRALVVEIDSGVVVVVVVVAAAVVVLMTMMMLQWKSHWLSQLQSTTLAAKHSPHSSVKSENRITHTYQIQ